MTDFVPARAYYMINLLDALRALGGSALSTAVYEWMEEHKIARPSDLDAKQKDGGSRFRKEVRFARKELYDAGLLDNRSPGEWHLTAAARTIHLTHALANDVVRLNQKLRPLGKARASHLPAVTPIQQKRSNPRPTWGPKPVSWVGVVARGNLGPAYTYVMRFGESQIWKIGHAQDLASRLSEVNKHVPSELLEAEWHLVTYRLWENSILAHAMEKRTFQLLETSRTVWERVRCTENTLMDAWTQAAEQVAALIEAAPAEIAPHTHARKC